MWRLLLVMMTLCLLFTPTQGVHPGCNGYHSNGNNGYCKACRGNYQRIYAGSYWLFWSRYWCNCPSGTYYNGGSSCPGCTYKCSTCYSSSGCYSCSSSTRSGTPSCNCKTGYYESGRTTCNTCPWRCTACSGASSCSSCVSSTRSGSTCACRAGYYETGSNTCPSCNWKCATCSSSSTNCQSCISSTRQTSSCNCKAGYYESGATHCPTCPSTCSTCTSSTNCQSCKSSTRQTPRCTCKAGYYENGATTCPTCPSMCSTCTSSTNCQSCKSSTRETPRCTCKIGYYETGATTCPTCDRKCVSCTSSSTNCLTCQANRGTAPSCPCLAKFYDNGGKPCAACHHSCDSCTQWSKCDTCASSKKRYFGSTSSYCLCQDRFYDPGSETCVSCHPTCFRCSGGNSNQCLSCNADAHRVKSGSSCICKEGYYQTSSNLEQCSKCNYRCKSCSSSSTNCGSCDSALQRTKSGSSCPCQAKYFQNSTGLCDSCHSSCATCTNKSECATCISSQYTIKNSTGLCSCQAGRYWSSTRCYNCNYRCLTCVDSSTKCTACPANTKRTLAGNTCNCDVGYYDGGSSTCGTCHYTCLTCSNGNANGCVTCQPSEYRTKTSSNYCNCMTGYFNSGTQPTCLKCHYSCKTCSTASTCSSCDSSLKRVSDSSNNRCKCQSDHFEHNNECFACLSTCVTCSNNQTCDTCNSGLQRTLDPITRLCVCKDGYYLNSGGTCSACDWLCVTCSDGSTCDTCRDGLNRTYNSTSKKCECDERYVLQHGPNSCKSCAYNCLTCKENTTTSCLTCHPNSDSHRTHNSGSLKCPCDIGYFDDGSTYACDTCDYSCKSCVDSKAKCTACPDGSHRTHVSSSWTCPCDQHYYDQNVSFVYNPTCQACLYHCSSCVRGSNCSSCNSTNHRVFDDTNNFCICDVGFYDDKNDNEKCKTCNYTCLTCTNSSHCHKCQDSHFRGQPELECPCIEGYYDPGTGNPQCLACHYTCKTCTNGSKCVSCEGSYAREMNSGTKRCDCKQRFFDTNSNEQKCSPCSYECVTCVDSATKCLTCNSTARRTIDSGQNKCPCDNGYYDDAVEECAKCHYSCFTCGNDRSCLTCDSAKQRSISSLSGLCGCNVGFWDDNSTETCHACHDTCISCINDTECKTCDINRNRVFNRTLNYASVKFMFCPCKYQHYSLGDDKNCAACHYSCGECSGSAKTHCLYCSADAKRTLTSNQCLCDKGYFDDNVTESCPICNRACTDCWTSSNTTCRECHADFFMMEGKYTCYETCPTYFWDDTSDMTCDPCESYCLTCTNATNCTSCEAPAYLFQSDCDLECELGYYKNDTTRSCELCREGCANCSASTNCFQCVNTSYYVDKATTLCMLCSSQCLQCFGPMENQCSNCTYPLFLSKKHQCVELTCPFGTYKDTIQGCVRCANLHPYSLTCNKTEAFKCRRRYINVGGVCTPCGQVDGYTLDSLGRKCTEKCGDGKLIHYQCDDGNRQNGDGCSASCVIEEGWNCEKVGQGSQCTLKTPPNMWLKRFRKYAGRNRLRVSLKISLFLRLTSRNFAFTITGLTKSQDYTVTILPQKRGQLDEVDIDLDYKVSIEGRSVSVEYGNQARLLQESPQEEIEQMVANFTLPAVIQDNEQEVTEVSPSRMLISFSTNIQIDSFPPAQFIDEGTISYYQDINNAIFFLALGLTILNYLIIPHRYALHSLTMAWIVPYFYCTFFVSTTYTTEWITSAAEGLRWLALEGGISIGDCCEVDDFKNVRSEVLSNVGVILGLIIFGWLLFGFCRLLERCISESNCLKVVLSTIKYLIFAVSLIVYLQLTFASMYALANYQLYNEYDTVNITLSLLMVFISAFALVAIWYTTKISKFAGVVDDISSRAVTRHSVSKADESSEESSQTESNQPNPYQTFDLPDAKELAGSQTQGHMASSLMSLTRGRHTLRTSNTGWLNKNNRQPERNEPQASQSNLDEQMADEPECIYPYDFANLYRHSRTSSKYFLPLFLTKLFLICIINTSLTSSSFVLLSAQACLNLVFIIILIKMRPFASKFTNFRLVFIEAMVMIVNGGFAYYQLEATKDRYNGTLELAVMVGMMLVIATCIIFSVVEHFRSWLIRLFKMCCQCCQEWSLSQKVIRLDAQQPSSKREALQVQVIEEESQRSEAPSQDAFYARIIKKNELNHRYKRQRMIPDRRPFYEKDIA